jgi:hypothetical protein
MDPGAQGGCELAGVFYRGPSAVKAPQKSLLLLLLVALCAECRGVESPPAATVAEKKPGQRVTLAWDYPAANEPTIQGFLLKQAPSPEGPFRTVVARMERNQREVEFAVSFEPGTSKSFYVVVALTDNKETAPTNAVEIRKKSTGPQSSRK